MGGVLTAPHVLQFRYKEHLLCVGYLINWRHM